MQRNKIVLSQRFKLTLASMVLLSVLAGTIVAFQLSSTETPSTQNGASSQEDREQSQNHFSVIYRGFIPDHPQHNASYPDYYICINDLANDFLESYLLMEILNQETSGYYFQTELELAPPGWAVSWLNYSLGYTVFVDVDRTVNYYIVLNRTKPSSIPEGRITESLDIVVKAYYDPGCNELYSQDSFTVTFHLIDRTSPVWTVLYYDNFDDGTNQGWWGTPSYTLYRSYRYSLTAGSTESKVMKTFQVPEAYQEAYLIYSEYMFNIFAWVKLNGTIYFYQDIQHFSLLNPNEWHQLTVPLWIGSTQVEISATRYNNYVDDVYVIAK